MKNFLVIIVVIGITVSCQESNPLDLTGSWDIIDWVEGQGNYYVDNNDVEASLRIDSDGSMLIEIEDEEIGLLGSEAKWEINQDQSTITIDFNDGDIFGENDDIIEANFLLSQDTLRIQGESGQRKISLVLVR